MDDHHHDHDRTPAPPLESGIPCPACGLAQSSVVQTIRRPGRLERVRRCSDCGTRYRTVEHLPDRPQE